VVPARVLALIPGGAGIDLLRRADTTSALPCNIVKLVGPGSVLVSMKIMRHGSILACVVALFVASPVCRGADTSPPRDTRIDNARIFPFFASGGGWQSTISLINVFESNIGYKLSFRGVNGQPLQVSYRTPDGRITSADTIQGQLGDDSSTTFVLIDAGVLQTGWVRLDYDGESRIAGLVTFRQRITGRPDFESSVTLAREDETPVYLPFDNTLGYATTLALTNPSATDNTDLQLRFWDPSGSEIITRTVTLSAGTTTAFSIPDRYPELVGRSGQLRIQGSASRLATLALRFNPSGAFSTIPVASR